MRLKGQRWLVLLAAVVTALLTARLGVWQLDRAAQKNQLQSALMTQRALPPLQQAELPRDAALATAQQHRLVLLQGRWLPEHTVFLDNRQMNGRPGFYVLTPLRLDDASVVLVQRGWVPRDLLDRTRIAAPPPPDGTVSVLGRIAPGAARLYEFDKAASGPIRQNLELEGFAREGALPLRPLVVVQEDGPTPPLDGLLRQWSAPAADVHKHYGYAFQWFSLCALILGLYVWFQLIQPRRRRR